VSFWRSKRGALTLSVVVLLALFLVRPGANRLRTRIVNSISLALGRPVDIAAVKVRLLPQPGFDLENFVIHDDPAFSAEPMLRAQEVTASLRVTSLLRGRLEIARLNLTEPSLNLVRNAEGHWNLENLIERAAKMPVAPTSKKKTERRPGFPYIEADRGRINFKFGPEKKPYALTEADFALWQDSENAWGMRLKAQPVRTDFNLTDTGMVTINKRNVAESNDSARDAFAVQPAVGPCTTRPSHKARLWQRQGLARGSQRFCHDCGHTRESCDSSSGLGAGFPSL